MLVAVDSWCSMCPALPSGNAGGLKRSRKREKNRPFASGKWTCVRVLGRCGKNVHMKMQIIFCSRGELC